MKSYFLFITKTHDNAYILTITTAHGRRKCVFSPPITLKARLKILSPRREGVEYFAAHHEGYFYIVTNRSSRKLSS